MSDESSVQDFFGGLAENILPQTESYVMNYFSNTKTGAAVKSNLRATVITDWLKNPIVWIVGIIVLIFVVRGLSK